MTEKQHEIYNSLKAIGEEISEFYKDGVTIISTGLVTKSYLLGHILREIDGGLRDIFGQSKENKEKFQKNLSEDELAKLFAEFKEAYKDYHYLKDISFNEFKTERGHVASVMTSFGFSIDSRLSKEYLRVTRYLFKYAHRSGAFNKPRDPQDMIRIWGDFEEILHKLIGSYYFLANQIDLLLRLEEPTDSILKTLPNLFILESRRVYFFNNLKSPKWLLHLYNEGYFNGALNPEPIESKESPGLYSNPHWPALTYLQFVSAYNLQKPDKSISNLLVLIFDDISLYRKGDGTRIQNYITDHALFTLICNLEQGLLKEGHFRFVEDALQSKWGTGLIAMDFGNLLKRLMDIGDKPFLQRGTRILLTHKILNEEKYRKVYSIFQNYELSRLFSENKVGLVERLGFDLVKIAIDKMDELISIEEGIFNNIRIPAIEDHEQTSFPEDFGCQVVYLLRDSLELIQISEAAQVINDIRFRPHPIFKRVAFHVIRVRYSELGDLFWNWGSNPLDNALVKHELYELMKLRSSEFTPDQIVQVITWIQTKKYFIPEDQRSDVEIVKRIEAYQKREWLSTLKSTGNPEVLRLIEELEKISDAVIDHPGFDFWHGGLFGSESPISEAEFLKLSIEDGIQYFRRFGQEKHSFNGPSVEGLADTITMTVRHNPEKYSVNCKGILFAPSHFKSCWMRGLSEAWREEGKHFECTEILAVVDELIVGDQFWEGDTYLRWFTMSLLSFIENATRQNSHFVSADSLLLVKRILLAIHDREDGPIEEYNDLSMTVLNSVRGKVFMCLIFYSLYKARMEGNETDRWDSEIKSIFNSIVASSDQDVIPYFVLGQFLRNIDYLDSEWLYTNFSKIFPQEHQENWEAAFGAYLFYNPQPVKDYFKHFDNDLHYQKGLVTNFDKIGNDIHRNLIAHICIGYIFKINGFNINHGLISNLISIRSDRNWTTLANFFWVHRNEFTDEVREMIPPLWSKIFWELIDGEINQIERDFLSKCCKWVNSVTEINDRVLELLIASAQFVSQLDRYAVIDGLFNHLKKSPDRVGLILCELSKGAVTYDISRGKILEIVEALFERGHNEIASKICLLHAEKGHHFLRDVYDRFNRANA